MGNETPRRGDSTPHYVDEDGWDKPVRYSLDLTADDYRALCAEWARRRGRGQGAEHGGRTTMRSIIVELIREHIPPAPPQVA